MFWRLYASSSARSVKTVALCLSRPRWRLPFYESTDFAFDGIGAAQTSDLRTREDGVVRRCIQVLRHEPEILPRCHPTALIQSREIHGIGVRAQRLAPVTDRILMEEGHDELADRTVDGLAVPQNSVIGFADGAPVRAQLEHGDHVVIVKVRCRHVDEQRQPSVQAQCQSRKHRSFDAVRTLLPKHAPGRKAGIPLRFKIHWERIEVLLDLPGGGERAQYAEFLAGQAVIHTWECNP